MHRKLARFLPSMIVLSALALVASLLIVTAFTTSAIAGSVQIEVAQAGQPSSTAESLQLRPITPTPAEALILAIRDRDHATVDRLLSEGADPNAVPETDRLPTVMEDARLPPIFEAVLTDDPITTEALLKAGARIDARHLEGGYLYHSVLSFAARHGANQVAELVIDWGADVTGLACETEHCGNVMTMTAIGGNGPLLSALSDRMTDVEIETNLNLDGLEAAIDLLLQQRGFDSDTRDIIDRARYWQMPPLNAAAQFGHLAEFEILLGLGADIDGEYRQATPIDLARRHRHQAIATMILAEKQKSDRIIDAIGDGDVDRVRSLITEGVNVNNADVAGLTPLVLATLNGNEAIMRLLLAAGADPDKGLWSRTTGDDQKPIHVAARKNHLDLVQLLLEAGADPNATYTDDMGEYRYTALGHAVAFANTELVSLLISAGADPAWSADPGHSCRPATYLDQAAVVGSVDLVRRFAAEGNVVDPTPQQIRGGDGNFWGFSPLMNAACGGHPDIVVVLLEEYGVNPSTKNRGGCNALDYAIINGHSDVADLLWAEGSEANPTRCGDYPQSRN